MQLHISFSALLTTVLVVLSCQDADARPMKRGVGMITLPLKRVHQARGDIHPQVLLQQHINRSQRRFARMTGRQEPSDVELRSNLDKRMFLLPHGPPTSRPSKRFNAKGTNGVPAAKPVDNSAISLDDEAKPEAATSNDTAAAGDNSGGISDVEINTLLNDGTSAANKPTTNNSLGLDIIANDVGYFALVQIGTPPQVFRILMDSGSADLWVGAENCKSANGGGCGNHTFLGTQGSASFVETKEPFNVTYGTGAVAGIKVTDNLNLAGLALDKHQFGVAQLESVDFSADSVEFDGLMGLAQSSLSNQQTLTPIEALAQKRIIQEAITSYKISRLADQKNDGEITFGGLDETKFDPNTLVTLDNVNEKGFWEATMDSVTVDGVDSGLAGRKAILDTGTTLILAPAADAAKVHQGIQGAKSDGQGGFLVPCTTNASIALNFGGKSFAIDLRDLAFAPVDANNSTGDCVSAISGGNVGDATEWLVGDTFLKNAYFSTNVNKNQMSLAKLV